MPESLHFAVEGTSVSVSALLLRPSNARALYVVAHGAGAGMGHPFMTAVAEGLAEHGVGTLRYQFPYMEQRKRRPDPPHLLEATVRSAVRSAVETAPELPLIAGGKSLGGRMTSSAAAKDPLPGVRGLIFLGFPLHAPGKPGKERANHLNEVELPMLFLQGTRDSFAALDLLRPVCEDLGPRATLHVVEGADHSFKVPKRSGRAPDEVIGELAQASADWLARMVPR